MKSKKNKLNSSLEIEIYSIGALCKRSKILELNVRQALRELNLKANIQIFSEFQQLLASKVSYFPALIINNQMIFQGKLTTVSRIKKILQRMVKVDMGQSTNMPKLESSQSAKYSAS